MAYRGGMNERKPGPCPDYFAKKVAAKCSVEFLTPLKAAFDGCKNCRDLFRSTCFGYLLDFNESEFIFHGPIIHALMQRHLGDLRFKIHDSIIRFGEMDYTLVMGLKWAPYKPNEEKNELRDWYFQNYDHITKKDLMETFESLVGSKRHSHVVKFALLLCVEYLIVGLPGKNKCVEEYISLANSIDDFNNYPWGRVGYEILKYHANTAIKAHYPDTYVFCGNTFALQVWAYESFPPLTGSNRWASRRSVIHIPRFLNWKMNMIARSASVSKTFEKDSFVSTGPLIPTADEEECDAVIDVQRLLRNTTVISEKRSKKNMDRRQEAIEIKSDEKSRWNKLYKILLNKVSKYENEVAEVKEENQKLGEKVSYLEAELEAVKGKRAADKRDGEEVEPHTIQPEAYGYHNVDDVEVCTSLVVYSGGHSKFVTPPHFTCGVAGDDNMKPVRARQPSRFQRSPFTEPGTESEFGFTDVPGFMNPLRQLSPGEYSIVKAAYDSGDHYWLHYIWDNVWVDDGCINAYMDFLTDRRAHYPAAYPQDCLFVSTWFWVLFQKDVNSICKYAAGDHSTRETMLNGLNPSVVALVARSAKPMWQYETVYFPVHVHESHWTLIVIYPMKRQVWLIDSIATTWKKIFKSYARGFTYGLRWLFHICDDGNPFWEVEWHFDIIDGTPKQTNSDECGVYVMKAMDFLCSGLDVQFTPVRKKSLISGKQ